MGTKSYVKPICAPRVHSLLLVGLGVNINEIQSPCNKKVGKVAKVLSIEKRLREEADKRKNELSQKDLETIEKLCNICDDSHDDH